MRDEIRMLKEQLAEANRGSARAAGPHQPTVNQERQDDRNSGSGNRGRDQSQERSDLDEIPEMFIEEDAAERARAMRAFHEGQKKKELKKPTIPDIVPGFKEDVLGIGKCYYCDQ